MVRTCNVGSSQQQHTSYSTEPWWWVLCVGRVNEDFSGAGTLHPCLHTSPTHCSVPKTLHWYSAERQNSIVWQVYQTEERFTSWIAQEHAVCSCAIHMRSRRSAISAHLFDWAEIVPDHSKCRACATLQNVGQPDCMVLLFHVIWCRQTHCFCNWHLLEIASAVHFERGVGNAHETQVSQVVFCCELALKDEQQII